MAACGGRTQPGNTPLPQCAGLTAVIVTNGWNQAVDISAGDPDNAGFTLLGSVMAGERAEYTLPAGTKRVTMARIRTIDPDPRSQNMMQSMYSQVRFRYVCR